MKSHGRRLAGWLAGWLAAGSLANRLISSVNRLINAIDRLINGRPRPRAAATGGGVVAVWMSWGGGFPAPVAHLNFKAFRNMVLFTIFILQLFW